MKVLIVDDMVMMRAEMRTIMNKLGHDVVMAKNGRDAVIAYKEHSPDLVMMDINMPGMTGIKALTRIIDKDINAKVLMVTTNGAQKLVVHSIQVGALGYILKPININAVKEAIDKVFHESDEYHIESLLKDV